MQTNKQVKNMKAIGDFDNPVHIKGFLIAHLNRIHCAKAHLLERLPELSEQADFKSLKKAILQTWEDIQRQMARIEEIYVLLDEEPSMSYCDELVFFVENGFSAIFQQRSDPKLRDLSILFYLSIIESIELASFQLLQMATVNLPNKQIQHLLKEAYDEAKVDRVLFLQITAIYMC